MEQVIIIGIDLAKNSFQLSWSAVRPWRPAWSLAFEVVDQVDDVVAAATGAHSDASAGDGDGEMGLAGAGAAGEFLDQGIVDW